MNVHSVNGVLLICRPGLLLVCMVASAMVQATEGGAQRPATQPTAQLTNASANDALSRLLSSAGALMKSGKAAEAYALLEPKEFDYSGDISYDYLLGVAALDSGKLDRAVIAFERVLTVNPNFSGARLDLGRAYFAMGSDALAEKEFKIVLSQNPPAQVRPVVEKFLETIAERRKNKLQQVSSYLELGVGRDSNVTSTTTDFTKGVLNTFNFAGVQPTGSSVLRAASFSNLSGGVALNRVVDELNGVSVFVGLDLKKRWIKELAQLNNANFDLNGGVSIARDVNIYRVYFNLNKYFQEGMTSGVDGNRSTPAVGVEWKRNLGDRDQVSLTGQYSRPRYATQETQDSNQTAVGVSLLHIFAATTSPLIFASVNRSTDHALKPLASGSDTSRKTTGLRLHLQFTPLANTDVFLSGGVSRRNDSSPNARSTLIPEVYGRDVTQDGTLGTNWRFSPKWTFKAQVSKYNNVSNLSLYNYRRTESLLSIRRDF